jgi:hypothetical protein
MDRRTLLLGAPALMAHAAFPGVMSAFAAQASAGEIYKPVFFDDTEMRILAALVDVILPETDSPSGTAARTHIFIDMAVNACASEEQKKVFRNGLAALGKAYTRRSSTRQAETLKALSASPFFRLLKDYTLTGYFTSEPGATKALAYVQSPGRYEGCIPLKPGQKSWQSD